MAGCLGRQPAISAGPIPSSSMRSQVNPKDRRNGLYRLLDGMGDRSEDLPGRFDRPAPDAAIPPRAEANRRSAGAEGIGLALALLFRAGGFVLSGKLRERPRGCAGRF